MKKEKENKLKWNWIVFVGGFLLLVFYNFIFGILILAFGAWEYNSIKKDLEDIELKLAGVKKKQR